MNADKELLLEVASIVPQDKMVVNVGVHEGVIKVFVLPSKCSVYFLVEPHLR